MTAIFMLTLVSIDLISCSKNFLTDIPQTNILLHPESKLLSIK
jgi:hypothetical protein